MPNRKERRSAEAGGKEFFATCKMCEAAGHHARVVDGAGSCRLHVIERHGKKELGICLGCPCATGKCDSCGRTGDHWLGCKAVGLPERQKTLTH